MRTRYLAFPILILILAAAIAGQDQPPANNFTGRDMQDRARANILRRELKLSPEQMMMIRKINTESRPQMREAQQRVWLARKELDAAVYADELDEETLRMKVRAVIEAEAEVTRIRAMSEVAVRKVLTPEQLERFRRLRQRFARQAEEMRMGPDRRRDGFRRNRPPGEDTPKEPPFRP